METLDVVLFLLMFHQPFYPTYEEWKPERQLKQAINAVAFYPTYEEWKLALYF